MATKSEWKIMAKKFRVFPPFENSYMSTYAEYIRSSDWKYRADEFKEAKSYTCEQCGLRGGVMGDSDVQIHVHHKHYRTLGREKQKDVRVLCHWCHQTEHPKWR